MRLIHGFVALGALFLLSSPASAISPGRARCERFAALGLRGCVAATLKCDACAATAGPCKPCDAIRAAAAQKAARRVTGACDAAALHDLGFGAAATPAGVATRIADECAAEAGALFSRTFGGPQKSQLAGADAVKRSCLAGAHKAAATLIDKAYNEASKCVRYAHRRGPAACNTAVLDGTIAAAQAKAEAAIGAACTDLKGTLGMDGATYAGRAVQQARCMVASGHGNTAPLSLDCGPRAAVPSIPRGVWTQVTLDEATWGTRCGDGSSYAFWVRLAPEGSPVENAIVHLQGGGVCIFESDCQNIQTSYPDLYEASSDYQPNGPTGGIFSTDANVNPFHDWTMVALPYCTQDVHIGGGGSSVFNANLTVNRFGGLNVRASTRYLRDLIWRVMNETEPAGYTPDKPRTLLVGESAGGYGVMYNYHYVLDDLGWAHTTAVPDSSLALDNGSIVGISGLGAILGAETGALGWKFKSLLPTYCQAGNCAVGKVLMPATAPRLLAVPEQQWLNLSNQYDSTQVSTQFFSGPNATANWITEMRNSYCQTRGLNGVHYFLPAKTNPIHTMLSTGSRYTTLDAGGVTVRDFLAAAVDDPAGVVDRVDEGDIATTFGVSPFACLP